MRTLPTSPENHTRNIYFSINKPFCSFRSCGNFRIKFLISFATTKNWHDVEFIVCLLILVLLCWLFAMALWKCSNLICCLFIFNQASSLFFRQKNKQRSWWFSFDFKLNSTKNGFWKLCWRWKFLTFSVVRIASFTWCSVFFPRCVFQWINFIFRWNIHAFAFLCF